MKPFVLRSRPPQGERADPVPVHDADVIAGHLEDAAHYHGGHAAALYSPASEAEIAAILKRSSRVLPIGAQSSLTGGATPMGDTLLSTRNLKGVRLDGVDRVRVQAGVTLLELDEVLARAGRYYPPAPTFRGAFVGGTLSTNAAGAATFKYGTTRNWVESMTVVLAGGDVLDLERGATRANRDGFFDVELSGGPVRVPVPSYRMPKLDKLSAGYFAEPDMDLIDLFIGSEGTLGVITEATLRVVPARPAFCLAFVTFAARARALEFVRRLRETARTTWATDPRGIDVSAIEHIDARSLQLLREDGVDVQQGITWPADSAIALLVTLELAADMTSERGYAEIGALGSADAPDTPLVRFAALLDEYNVTDRTLLALPGDSVQAAKLLELREAVPAGVNRRVGQAKRSVDARIEKTAADMIVPFDRFEAMLQTYERELARRGLDAAIWGHISDGNVHPNVIPRTFADVESGREAILEFGRETIRLGGAPLAEHGVGRNPTKQKLLRELYGDDGIASMRRVKAALDPDWKLSPGVIFVR